MLKIFCLGKRWLLGDSEGCADRLVSGIQNSEVFGNKCSEF